MLSHLSQSLLLNCCIPSPSAPSPPVHLHTHTRCWWELCIRAHISAYVCIVCPFESMYETTAHIPVCVCIYIYYYYYYFFFMHSTAHGYCLKMQRSISFFPHSPRFPRPSQPQFPPDRYNTFYYITPLTPHRSPFCSLHCSFSFKPTSCTHSSWRKTASNIPRVIKKKKKKKTRVKLCLCTSAFQG